MAAVTLTNGIEPL